MKRNRLGKTVGAVSALVAMLLVCVSCTSTVTSTERKPSGSFSFCYDPVKAEGTSENEQLAAFSLMAESDTLRLWADEANANVAVEDKRSGKIWSAIPLDLDTDTVATADMKEIMQSTVQISYYSNGSIQKLYSYPDCVADSGQKMTQMKDGVRFTFHMSAGQITFADLPLKINDARFQQFFVNHEALTAVDKKRINKYFEYDKKAKVWVRTKETDTVLTSLYDIMQRVGYTEDELKKDDKENKIQYKGGNRVYFDFSLDYTLDHDSLLVNLPLADMKYHKDFPPVSIVCNQMLLSDSSKDGYLVIPDGSGALVDFSKDQSDTGNYSLTVYGTDQATDNLDIPAKSIKTLMPIYGIKSKDEGVLAIIEDGDALSNITVNKAGTYNAYNTAWCEFLPTRSSSAAIGDGSMMSLVRVFQNKRYQGNLKVRYLILHEKADYATMAVCYRSYRMQRDSLAYQKTKENAQLQLQLIGGVPAKNSVLGFQYNGIRSLTDYQQANSIVSDLDQAGVSDIALRYRGIWKGGLAQDALYHPGLIGSLGTQSELKKLSKQVNNQLYPDVSLLTVGEDSGGFSKQKVSKTLDQALARVYQTNPVTGDKEKSSYVLSPSGLAEYLNAFLKGTQRLPFDRYSFSDLGSVLYGDYNKNKSITTQNAKWIALSALYTAKQQTKGVLLNSPIVDAASYADLAVNLPLYSNQVPIISRSVPFLEITLSGLITYSGEAYNEANDRDVIRLKSLETGAMPSFTLFWESNTQLRNTDYTNMTSNQFKIWRSDLLNFYQDCQQVTAVTKGTPITGHSQIAQGVYRTEYANGAKVWTNYNKTAVTVEDLTINGMDYHVEG